MIEMTKDLLKTLISIALLIFGAILILAGLFAPTNEIVVKLPLMSMFTEIDRNGNLVMIGTGADARWLEIGEGLVLAVAGYLLHPRDWEL